MQDRTIWIDVTMLVNWSGQLTGIQRVEYNLAKRFSSKKNVSFCTFDKVSQKLVEFDFKHIEYKVSMLQIQHDRLQDSVNQSDASAAYRKLLKKIYLGTVKRVPRKATAVAGRIYRKVRSRSSVVQNSTEVLFHEGDVFFILSGDWSDNIFADWVKSTKQKTPIKVIQIVYDMLPYVQPAYFVEGMSTQFTNYMKSIFSITDGILAISKSTKRDVERFVHEFALNEVPVKVFRLGDDFVKHKEVKPKVDIEANEFLLCVGTIEARKNHLLLYYAVREAINQGIDIKPIVVVGKVGWLAKDFFYLVTQDPVLSKKFIFLNFCTDQELAWLFRNCTFTVYPSYYEGWGLPIAESLHYGKFCLSSDSSSMPEISGDLIEYFSPNDPMMLLNKIKKYSNSSDLLKEKEQRISNSYKTTSWDDTFLEVEKFINTYI